MLVIPAIDIMDGKCVRLIKGDFNNPIVYRNNPVEVAKDFEKKGAKLLHIVDLDGAKAGYPVNLKKILAISRSLNIPLQVGGGIRSKEDVRLYLKNGIERIILSTIAIENPKLLCDILKEFENSKILVSIDIKEGKIATQGWRKKSKKNISDFVRFLKKLGVSFLVVTDISKDGLLGGPNLNLAKKFINEGFKTIVAGGISSLRDLEMLKKQGAFGAIVGRAIYEGKIDLKEAQKKIAFKSNLAKRIIVCLDVKNGRVVKGIKFKKLRDIGDPIELARRYSNMGADELLFLDITATIENRKPFYNLISKIAKEINIPFTVGGGILTIEDIRNLLKAGADKVSIGTGAVRNPNFIKKAVKYFGSQCIVVSIDAKKEKESWKIYIKSGTEKTEIDAIEFSKQMEAFGVGELLVNSLDRDGTQRGFDLKLLKAITDKVNIPVIASSGAGKKEDFLEVFQKTQVDAVLGASIFHSKKVDIRELKKFLSAKNLPIHL